VSLRKEIPDTKIAEDVTGSAVVSYPDTRLWTKAEPEQQVFQKTRRDYPSPPPYKSLSWKEAVQKWLRKIREEHKRGQIDPKHGRRFPLPRPYLDCTSHFGPQIIPLKIGQTGSVSFTVWNDGNFPAWTCYVEVYEGPTGYTSPLSDYEIRGRRIITIQPGETREVTLPWVRMRRTGRIVGICYDPLLDPRDFVLVEQYNRHITSVHYVNLDGVSPGGPGEM
jgi:hypothetical protein